MPINWPAVRALRHLWRLRSAGFEDARAADHGFDAGEWSAAWHDTHEYDAYNAAVAYVAERYLMLPHELDCMIDDSSHFDAHCYIQAQRSH